MPLDPNIPLSVKPPAIPDPLAIVSAVAQLQGVREQTEARRAAVEERRLAGEERRQKAAEEAAKRQRAELAEQRVRGAIRLDPTTGRPSLDFAKLLDGEDVPPATIFEFAKEADAAAKHLADLELANLTLDEKRTQSFGALARPVMASGYAKPAWDAALLAAYNKKLITVDERDAGYAIDDPAAIKQATDAALAQAGLTPKPSALQKVTKYDPATGQTVETFVTPTEGAEFLQPPPNAATGELPSYQDTDAIVTLPTRQRITGKVGYNPKTNTYAPIGSTEPFPPGTKVDRIPTPTDPTVAAIRDLTLQTARQNAQSGMTPQQSTVFQRIADAYERSPLVKAADRTIVLKQAIKDAKTDPTNATHQLNLAYAYIQALDTYQSAVREGELQNLGVLGTRLQELGVTVNRYVTSGAFIPPAVATQIATSAQTLAETIETGRRQKQREFGSRAEVSGVGPAWKAFIAGGEPAAAPDPLKVTAPNGTTYTFKSAAEAAAFKRRAGIP